jgi:preprotein translocase subunit Sec63
MVSKSNTKEIKEFDPYDILEIDRENFDLDTAKKNFRYF